MKMKNTMSKLIILLIFLSSSKLVLATQPAADAMSECTALFDPAQRTLTIPIIEAPELLNKQLVGNTQMVGVVLKFVKGEKEDYFALKEVMQVDHEPDRVTTCNIAKYSAQEEQLYIPIIQTTAKNYKGQSSVENDNSKIYSATLSRSGTSTFIIKKVEKL